MHGADTFESNCSPASPQTPIEIFPTVAFGWNWGKSATRVLGGQAANRTRPQGQTTERATKRAPTGLPDSLSLAIYLEAPGPGLPNPGPLWTPPRPGPQVRTESTGLISVRLGVRLGVPMIRVGGRGWSWTGGAFVGTWERDAVGAEKF